MEFSKVDRKNTKQMNTFFLFLFFATFSLTTFSQNSDSTEIINLLKNDYKALANLDFEEHIKNCAEDYMLIENGEVWDIKKEIEILFNLKTNSKITRQDQFDFKTIKIDGPYAYAVYELKSEITKNLNTKKYNWTETAIFYKVSEKWKIKLIHSTKKE